MAKIKFNQPKYVIPLIITPFVIFTFFIWGGKIHPEPVVTSNSPEQGFNPNMPGVDTSISKGDIKNKFDAYQQAFKGVRDYSGMEDIKRGNGGQGLEYNSAYTPEDIERMMQSQKMDSLTDALNNHRSKINDQFAQFHQNGGFTGGGTPDVDVNQERQEAVLARLLKAQQAAKAITNSGNSSEEATSGSDYDAQMRVFKEQMHYMDSLQRSNGINPVTGEPLATSGKAGNSYSKTFDPTADTSFKPLPISAVKPTQHQVFNTLRRANPEDEITAMIDQDVKATLGSRVRIRLLKDMYVGDNLVKKGTYIYAVVTGFQKQRVNLSIAQVMYNNSSLPVKIDLFDNDGYLGLYVPGSNFREFTKEIGTQATQGMSTAVTPDGSDIKMNMLSQVFNTTTTTIASLVRKDKAFLKYNYIVYLKENKTSSQKN